MKKHKKKIIFFGFILLILLILFIWEKYDEYECKITKDEAMIEWCATNLRQTKYEKLQYMKSKLDYIHGGSSIYIYKGLLTMESDIESKINRKVENEILRNKLKSCMYNDVKCLSAYIDVNNPSENELMPIYEQYLKSKQICNESLVVGEYTKLTEKLNIPNKYLDESKTCDWYKSWSINMF